MAEENVWQVVLMPKRKRVDPLMFVFFDHEKATAAFDNLRQEMVATKERLAGRPAQHWVMVDGAIGPAYVDLDKFYGVVLQDLEVARRYQKAVEKINEHEMPGFV